MVLPSVVLRRVLVISSIGWALSIPLASFAASRPSAGNAWYTLAFLVYGVGSVICHQLPERSFYLWSAQWPVCARCTGIYFGAAVAAIVAVRLKPDTTYDRAVRLKRDLRHEGGTTRRARLILAGAALPSAMTLVYEWTTGDTPSNVIRALAGAPLGAAIVFIIIRALPPYAGGSPAQDRSGPGKVRLM